MTSVAQHAAPAGAAAVTANPWPCDRCGTPVQVDPRAGRLPRSVLVAGLLLLAMLGLTVARWDTGLGPQGLGACAALLLLTVLGLHRRAHAAWRCPRCRLSSRGRQRPAGQLTPAIAIPTYNNGGTIAEVVRRAREAAPGVPILVVDDGSTDDTGARARAALGDAPGEVLAHAKNRGKGAALRSALERALARGHSHLVTLDGDGQHQPEDIPRLLEAARGAPASLLVGGRDLSGDNIQGASRFGRAFSNFWVRAQTGVKLPDSQSGFRVYPVAPVLSLGTRGRSYDFEVEVLVLGARAGIPLGSVPIGVYYPPREERVSHFDMLWDNVRISWVNTRLLSAALLWPLGWPARLSRRDPPSPVVRSWSGKSRGGAFGHLFFLVVTRLFGPRPAYAFLYPVTLYFMFAAPATVRASRAFLDRVLGPAPSRWRRFWRTFRHLHTFAQCILDRSVVLVRGGRDYTYDSEGEQYLTSPDGRGLLYLSAHVGNNELGGAFLAGKSMPVNVVMLDAEAEAIKRVQQRLFGTAPGPKIIAINKGELPALELLGKLRAGEAVALHGDRVVDPHWVWCDFFGEPAPIPVGSFIIAAAARVPVVLTFGFKEHGRHYSFVAEPQRHIELPRGRRHEALGEYARWYAAKLEEHARAHPFQWFNFYNFWAEPALPSEIEAGGSPTKPVSTASATLTP